ncbi:39S ribosomal protein L27, mitochondrial-like [Dermacentor silvarum]|uniref:39S ribosomal protein L27, mitochondrial-like n=1 Tax=Dermacentor silvarum TaxID=543639 RepID=UPI00189B7850|nr:39S ribosomal protein L27, mitochondrial-like [Dermacentor silvarum]
MAAALQRIISSLPARGSQLVVAASVGVPGSGAVQLQCVRGASKGNRPCRYGPTARGQRLNVYIHDGMIAHKGDMIVKQNRLRFHPGLNVVFGPSRQTLIAAVEGRVMLTREKVNLDFHHPRVQKFYEGRNAEALYKKYFHVIPNPQGQTFRLVSQI